MPAIQLGRLKVEAAQLANQYNQPTLFTRQLNNLFDFYADRAHRPGQSGEPHPLLKAYKVPTPVLREILKALSPHIEREPEAGFRLADALWAQPFWECRLVATSILGMLPVDPCEPLLDRLQNWALTEKENRLIDVRFE